MTDCDGMWSLAKTLRLSSPRKPVSVFIARGGEARIATRLKMAKGTHLAWLPQETILFNQSVLSRTLDVELEEGAEILVVEATIFGRLAMGSGLMKRCSVTVGVCGWVGGPMGGLCMLKNFGWDRTLELNYRRTR